MVTGHVRELYERDPRKVKIEYEKGKRWCDLWAHNPKIARQGEVGDFQIFHPRDNYLRPYCAKKEGARWTWKPYQPPRGEIFFLEHERAFGEANKDLVVLGPHLKPGAPQNKSWGRDKWRELSDMFDSCGIPTATLGPSHMERVTALHVVTTVREAAAVISRARLVVTHEGALHHIAAAVGVPAVVIFGGYISPEVTGYDDQVAFFRGAGLGCGERGVCQHCKAAMASITPDEVFSASQRLLNA